MANGERVSISQVGAQLMRYWPAILIIGFLIAAGAEARLQIRNHEKLIEILTKKLESTSEDEKQWRAIYSVIEDNKEIETRLKETEKHITPQAIQKWGEVQWMIEDVYDGFRRHEEDHP